MSFYSNPTSDRIIRGSISFYGSSPFLLWVMRIMGTEFLNHEDLASTFGVYGKDF